MCQSWAGQFAGQRGFVGLGSEGPSVRTAPSHLRGCLASPLTDLQDLVRMEVNVGCSGDAAHLFGVADPNTRLAKKREPTALE